MQLSLRLLPFLLFAPFFGAAQVYVNEYQSLNDATIADTDGEFSDWIELYNSSSSDVDLTGYFLSDDATNLTKYQIDGLTVPANGYALVFCSNKDAIIGGEHHTNFKLSSSGEEVFLVMPDGSSVLSQLPAQALTSDQSFGRENDGGMINQIFAIPTPNQTNNIGTAQVQSPAFSVEGGLYTSSFSLSLTPSSSNDTIYYTLNGDEPTTNSLMYTGPITIEDKTNDPNRLSMIDPTIDDSYPGLNWWDPPSGQVFKGMVVRAKSFSGNAVPSKTTTHTYLLGSDILTKYDSVLVISLVTDSVNLFSDSIGIYMPGDSFDSVSWESCNYSQRGAAWERPAHVEFFDPDSNMKRVHAQDLGIRISGNYTRGMNIKSMRLYARSEYGESHIDYDFFRHSDHDLNRHKRLTMRTSGHDAWNTLFRDLMLAEVFMDNQRLAVMHGRQSVLFIDGEFWGVYNLRTRMDKFFFEDVYGISADDGELDLLDIAESDPDEGSWQAWDSLDTFIGDNDISDSIHFAEVEKLVDAEQMADVLIYQIWIANQDWPQNNNKFWRKRVSYDPSAPYGNDGRFRWLIYDLDLGLGKSLPVNGDMVKKIFDNTGFSTDLFRHMIGEFRTSGSSLPGYAPYREYFLTRFADLMNSDLLPRHMLSTIDSCRANIESIAQENGKRNRRPPNHYWWDFEINKVTTFIENRPEYQYEHIMNRFPTGDTSWVHLDVNDESMGRVRVNTLTIDKRLNGWENQPYPWSGKYFDSLYTTVEALPRPGYVFVEWIETGDTNPLLKFKTTGDTTLTALFAVDQDYTTIASAWDLSQGPYELKEWSATTPSGVYPPNMMFMQTRYVDPVLTTPLEDPYTLDYNMTSKTRIIGLDTNGFAFFNTGSQTYKLDPDFQGRDLGGARLAVNTLGQDSVYVSWTAGTIDNRDKRYAVSLMARIGDSNPYVQVLDSNGAPVVYQSVDSDTTITHMPEVMLPDSMHNKPYVEILWKYHLDSGLIGSRSAIYLDDLYVGPTTDTVDSSSNFINDLNTKLQTLRVTPNPSTEDARLLIKLEESYRGDLIITDINGRTVYVKKVRLDPGSQEIHLGELARKIPNGVYLIRLANREETIRWLKQ